MTLWNFGNLALKWGWRFLIKCVRLCVCVRVLSNLFFGLRVVEEVWSCYLVYLACFLGFIFVCLYTLLEFLWKHLSNIEKVFFLCFVLAALY